MNQTANQTNQQLMLFIGIIVLIIVIATSIIVGGQVYWWQKSVAEKEKKDLQRQINSLQSELAFLREDLGKSLLKKSNSNDQTPVTDKIYMDNLAGREREAITALKNREMSKLAALVHPEKGVRFSPFSYVDTRSDHVFTRGKVKFYFMDFKKYTWGYNDSNGLPIKMNTKNYFDNFVYDCDYATADEINYNTTIGRSLTVSNIFEVYPRSIIVEFGKGNHGTSKDWKSIRLVFEKNDDDKWYLVGIVHDQWKL